MSRQTEHYDRVVASLALAADGVIDARQAAEAMQRDLNHGLAHAQTALDILSEHDDRDMLPEETMRDARNELREWLGRMGVADPLDTCSCSGHAFNPICPVHGTLTAGECDGDCPDGEAAEALEADRDALSATVERLYDGIDAALAALEASKLTVPQNHRAFTILRDLRPSVTA